MRPRETVPSYSSSIKRALPLLSRSENLVQPFLRKARARLFWPPLVSDRIGESPSLPMDT